MLFHDFERAWRVYLLEESVEWRWPPDVVERQLETLMDDLSLIRWLVARIRQAQAHPLLSTESASG